IIGTGVQARKHLEAIPLVRPIRRVLIAGRTRQRAEEFVRSISSNSGVSVEPAASVEDALRDADVVVTCTSSRDPVINRTLLRKGMHINVVGGSQPQAQALDPAPLADVLVVRDSRR